MCRIGRVEGHWTLVGSDCVRTPGGEVVTTRRAIYAAFVGPIGRDQDVRATCWLDGCCAPDHLTLAPARRRANPLSMPDQVRALHSYSLPRRGGQALPPKVTIEVVNRIKEMSRAGTRLPEIAAVVGIPIDQVVKARNGVYDGSFKKIGGSRGRARAARAQAEERAPVKNLSDDERAWLREVGRG